MYLSSNPMTSFSCISTQEPENFIYDNNQHIYNVPFGHSPKKSSKPNMGGFLSNFIKYRDPKYAPQIMRGLNQSTLPILYTLAKEYAISDVSGGAGMYVYVALTRCVLWVAMVFKCAR
jgi:hypothetical protein